MRNNNAEPYNESENRGEERSGNRPNEQKLDLSDSPRDKERLQPDETTINLPDVKDIPGQEFVHAPPLGMMADTTISSGDEEGEGLFEDDEEDETEIVMGTEADIPEDDKEMLERSDDFMPTKDDNNLRRASMDSTDFEGEPLNEGSFGQVISEGDLDIPENPAQSRTESMEQEDEENQSYSLGSADNDNVTEGTP
jgi:hypothetical protein